MIIFDKNSTITIFAKPETNIVMTEYIASNLWTIWGIVALFALIMELNTGSLYLLCFAIGACATSLISLTGISLTLQVIVFCICTTLCILLIKPKKLFTEQDKNNITGADAVIGKTGTVKETIPVNGIGWVMVYGDEWKAVSVDNSEITEGSKVEVISRDSLTIKVKKTQ